MDTDAQRTTVLYCEEHEDGQVTQGGVGDPVYEIKDHLVEVPQGRFANELLNRCMVVYSDFGGKFQFPRHVYRQAAKDEVARYQAGPRTRVWQSAQPAAQQAAVTSAPILHIEDVPTSLADLQRQVAALATQNERLTAQLAAVMGTQNVISFPDATVEGGADAMAPRRTRRTPAKGGSD